MAKRYVYLLSCPDYPWWPIDKRPGTLIQEMSDEAVDVSYETMVRHCQGLVDWAVSVGYERRSSQGLTLKQDFHVTFARSRYDGMRCYFVRWSAMEFIWVHETDLAQRGIPALTPPWLVHEGERYW